MKGPTKARKAKTETKTWTQPACRSLRGNEASLRLAGTRTLYAFYNLKKKGQYPQAFYISHDFLKNTVDPRPATGDRRPST